MQTTIKVNIKEKAMNLIGTGIKLTKLDYSIVAGQLGIKDPNKLRAIVQVEALGSGFDRLKRLKCLYEPHVAYARSAGSVRAKLVKAGLAYSRWGTKPYPKGAQANHARVLKAVAIAGDIAFEWASWGLPQMMGFNAKPMGYTSAKAMVSTMLKGEREQMLAMGKFLVWKNLVAKINAATAAPDTWRPIAYRYNGSKYEKNRYHIKLGQAYHKLSTGKDIPLEQDIWVKGDSGERVKTIQRLLVDNGFDIMVDGDFGRATDQAVKAFQRQYGLSIDGRVGPQTLRKLRDEASATKVVPIPTPKPKLTPPPAGGGGDLPEPDEEHVPWYVALLNMILRRGK